MKHYYFLALIFLFGCGGGGGGGSAPAPAPPALVAPVTTLSISSTELVAGEAATITWSSTNATSCSASGSWDGTKATSGSTAFTITPAGSYTFSLSCSGSGGSSAKSVSVIATIPLYSLSGTIKSLEFTALDGDVPNTSLPSIGNNIEPLEVQPLKNPSQVIGHAKYNAESDINDKWDLYSIDLVGGQYASLETTEWDEDEPDKNDLDLHVLNSNGIVIASSTGSETYEVVTLPASGTFYVAVEAYNGKSRYVLTIGSVYQGFKLSNYSSEVAIEKNKIRIAPRSEEVVFQSLIENDRYNRLNIQRESFFNFKRSNLAPNAGYLYEVSERDAELARAKRLYKESIAGSFFKPTDEQIDDMLFKKYISLTASLHKDFYVEPSFKLTAFSTFIPTDYYKYQWDHHAINTQEAVNAVGNKLNNTVVAVLDTGSPSKSSTAYALTNYVDGGYDFAGKDSDPTGPATKNHGAHVAGTIAANDNSNALNGMAVRVLPLRVLGEGQTNQGLIEALKFAAGEANSSGTTYKSDAFPVAAANLSLGACGTSEYVCNEISNLIARTGMPVVVSSGNCACNGVYSQSYCPVAVWPAACEGVIRVAASDFENKRANYSNHDTTVDITAPGGDDTVDKNSDGNPDGVLSFSGDEAVDFWPGTSMAAPHVAGAIALMKVVNPSLTPTDIDNMIIEGKMTNDIDAVGKDIYTGYGLLDVVKSVDEASKFEAGSAVKDSVNVSPTQLKYAFTIKDLNITITKVGSGNLSITGVYADQPDGIKFTPPGAELPFGTYQFSIDRSFYTEGSYQNTFYFGLSDGTYPRVTATFAVGDERQAPDLGTAYALLIDNETGDVVQEITLDISSGSAAYEFTNIDSSKKYRINIGSDIDSDNFICQWGEFCDSMPESNDPEFNYFTLDKNLTDVDFFLTPISAISLGSLNSTQASSQAETFPGN
ncbi:S8 family serine peptidase [Gammaproteobacteria bacterium]|nr:S8 family serine peptidase [Gammaproteobacteria bacterium]